MKRLGQFAGLIFIVILMLMLIGCQAKSAYSFDNPDIFAYINGEPVYESQKESYIEMKKAYYTDILDSIQETDDNSAVESDPYNAMLVKTYEIELDRMKMITSYNNEDWENDYLKTFIVEKQLNDYVADKKDSFEEFLNSTVDTAVQDALNTKGVVNYYNIASLNVEDVINKVAKELNLSYETCAKTVYADFVRNEFSYQYLINYFAEREYKGEKVEWNGTNIDEYTEYLSNVYTQYESYLSGLLDSAEIAKR